jgi:ATP-dependent Clp protease ATP-binding subunit ClpA
VRAAEYDRLSDAAHRAVVLAERAAREAGHEMAGPEHLLCALADTDDEVADRLAEVGVSRAALQARMAEWCHRGAPLERAVFSPALRRTVHLAGRLASQDRSPTVAGRHLLTALLEVEDEFVMRVLIGLGVDPGALRRRPGVVAASAVVAAGGGQGRRRGLLDAVLGRR